MCLHVMQKISTTTRIYLNNKNKSPLIFFFYYVLELECKQHCVTFQKDPEKGYHWNDPSRHLHACSQHEVVYETCFRGGHPS